MERAAHEDAVTFAWSATGTVLRTNLKAYSALLVLRLLCHLVGFAIIGNLVAAFGIMLVTLLACTRLVRPEARITRSTAAFSAAFSALWLATTIGTSIMRHAARYVPAWTLLIIAAAFVIAIVTLRIEAAPFFYALYPGSMRDALTRSWAFFSGKRFLRWFWINVAVQIAVFVVAIPIALFTARLPAVYLTLDSSIQVLQSAFLMCYLAYVTENHARDIDSLRSGT